MKFACKITPLQGLGLLFTLQSCWCIEVRPYVEIKHLLRCCDVEWTNALPAVFGSGPDSLALFHVTALIITLHTQIALWESDDFVSGRDNAEYDDQRSAARPRAHCNHPWIDRNLEHWGMSRPVLLNPKPFTRLHSVYIGLTFVSWCFVKLIITAA